MEGGRYLAWYAIVIDTLAESCRARSAEAAGAADEVAAERKSAKYTAILPSVFFVPLTFETPLDPSVTRAWFSFLTLDTASCRLGYWKQWGARSPLPTLICRHPAL